MLKHAYTVDEIIELIGISRSKIYAEFRAGRIVPRKVGRRTIVLAEDLQNYLEQLPTAAKSGWR